MAKLRVRVAGKNVCWCSVLPVSEQFSLSVSLSICLPVCPSVCLSTTVAQQLYLQPKYGLHSLSGKVSKVCSIVHSIEQLDVVSCSVTRRYYTLSTHVKLVSK